MAADVVVNADGSVTVTNFPDATAASTAEAVAITVGGVALDGFDPDVSTYVVDWPRNGGRIPAVGAVTAASRAGEGDVRQFHGLLLPARVQYPHPHGDLGRR